MEGFTAGMPSSERRRHAAAALAVVLGAGLLGASVGGMARMDGELRAATVQLPRPETRFVVHPAPRPDCDPPARPAIPEV